MAVAKGKYRWYNSKRELMFGSISHIRTYTVV
nr:MAG TPA: hypothetical protein [Caudoviricetes sp.]